MRRITGALALLFALTAFGFAFSAFATSPNQATAADVDAQQIAEGKALYQTACITCHGANLQGVVDRGPSLVGVGQAATYFQVITGRMPAVENGAQIQRKEPVFDANQTDQLAAYIQANGGGPEIPQGDLRAPEQISRGGELYRLNCAACHVASGSGAAIGGGRDAPTLMESTATEIGQAIRVGPGAMPVFGTFSDEDLNSVARYVIDLQSMDATGVDDFGGAGPVAEGLAAWLLALLPLIALTRWIGTPHEGRDAPLEPDDHEREVDHEVVV